ncbi:SDR family oxidoreductase [Novacetimonas hansenii]|nr:SDR family oxidoreductase [Novacetimonas hansenii]
MSEDDGGIPMNMGLNDRVAVVTGGSSGIGLATARELLRNGAYVAICGRDANRLAHAHAELVGLAGAGRVLAVQCDVLESGQVQALHDAVMAWRGGCHLLVNNAGQGRVSTFADTDDAGWREELDLKFFSQINTIRAFRKTLSHDGAGAIVAVNSLLAYQPEPHMVCTSAARAGVQNLLKSLACELAPAIRVNSVVVGLIESGQWRRRFEVRANRNLGYDAWLADVAARRTIPLGRLGKPEDVAQAIVFLGSSAAHYITGARIEVSGGLSRQI